MRLTRPHQLTLAAAFALAAFASPAAAQDGDVAGTYDVTFSEVANNCDEAALELETRELTLESRPDDQLVARLPGVPAMSGSERRGGQFRAEVRSRQSPIDGTRARYSVAGRVREGQIQLVFIAEYYRGDRPLCTQSWSGMGGAAPAGAGARARLWETAEKIYLGLVAPAGGGTSGRR